jgi:hypothetical protein
MRCQTCFLWVGHGLDRDTLEKILNTVFALAAPTP